jgi:hypothetical protein
MAPSVERIRVIAVALAVLCAACTPRAGEPPVTMPATASALAIAPDFSGTIWAATGRRVYRSRDGGHTWQLVPGRGGATGVAFLSTRVVAVGPAGVQSGGFGTAALPRPEPVVAPLAAVASRLSSISSCSAEGRETATGMESSATGDVCVPAATKTLRVQCTKAK